ncbi:queuosine precursor transporter [Candidatus Woesearchaeota archaeon]|jgi:queuosine precursor transporter|nr:queuosine precursor transporter [Candidatus Woesearchaeota archaeon]MBT5272495.1 queuosine precursor transporter [Candidatus Woesearchaeota archaeon]MBT6041497.1 queuosine precursor transporter [Candidatus Woesearchaeota archaeon]MBT6336357.1 queuosine precursor transporter [Candidatus Woesearchaeota archaeon]MBT7928259.1 queuosine precursor transporter [Candidatus Woesearchaeota archaeon]
MSNELLWIILLLVNCFMVVFAYRFFGKTGLYVWTAAAVILANIQVLKTVQLFGMVATLGNIIYGSLFLSTDILSENHGKKAARKAVWIGFFVLIAATIIMQICLQFIPDASDFAHGSLEVLFGFLPRIALASLTAYLISQNFDVWYFHFLKKKTKGKYLWLRNNMTTMTSQFFDSLIFVMIAFWGVFPNTVLWEIFLTTYVLKWIVALIDTPFIYWAKSMKN